ncbi:MAG: hypothetical protein GIKADHBN_03704 [Phycisphaerales bacterium]|nr:hypothetical protein [Phycisphaerales bacterium]MCK6478076.1 DUF4932 domain-containing protein [Phycisphaerales bacterium]
MTRSHPCLAAAILAVGIVTVPVVAIHAEPPAAPPPATAARAPATAISAGVDERVELLSIIARLAGNPEYNMKNSASPYASRVEEWFGHSREHAAITMFREGRRQFGWSYDAVPCLAVHLTAFPELAERMPIDADPRPPRLDKRWNPEFTRQWLDQVRDFIKVTSAAGFFDQEREFYGKVNERMAAFVRETDPVPWFDSFFGAKAGASYQVIPGLVCGGSNYGVGVVFLDGSPEEIRPVLGCWKWDKVGLPEFATEAYLPTFIHELAHSYVNPFVERHAGVIDPPFATMYPSIAAAMKRKAYATARTVACETIVRAVVIRYLHDRLGPGAGEAEKFRQKREGFPWAGGLADVLGEYSADRGKFPALDDFSPTIAEHMQSIAKTMTSPGEVAPR